MWLVCLFLIVPIRNDMLLLGHLSPKIWAAFVPFFSFLPKSQSGIVTDLLKKSSLYG
jgi:hypothetical protein